MKTIKKMAFNIPAFPAFDADGEQSTTGPRRTK